MRQKRVNYILDRIDFFIDLHKVLIPRAPFWIFLWVDSVQSIINRCRRAEI